MIEKFLGQACFFLMLHHISYQDTPQQCFLEICKLFSFIIFKGHMYPGIGFHYNQLFGLSFLKAWQIITDLIDNDAILRAKREQIAENILLTKLKLPACYENGVEDIQVTFNRVLENIDITFKYSLNFYDQKFYYAHICRKMVVQSYEIFAQWSGFYF
jgi:hypothetical protein